MTWRKEIAPPPAVVVIFGATGDLAKRKLFPALQNLYNRKLINKSSTIIACGRRAYDDETFRTTLDCTPDFAQLIKYCCGNNDSDELYEKLKLMLAQADKSFKKTPANHLFYLALSSNDMLNVCCKLSNAGMLAEKRTKGAWRHVIFEKPFGHDLESSRELNGKLLCMLDERQIYRIDHYLGKETVQNILMLRFANMVFEPLWRAEYIDHVEITAAEDIGVEQRGAYYNNAGALRDMFQNHMLQLLALTAMEVPGSYEAKSIRDEKTKLLKAVRRFDLDNLEESIVRGQYVAGNNCKSYREEKDIPGDSTTETYVALKLFIDNWRWRGVPFFLRSGKRLSCKKSEIAITFKSVPHSIFPNITPAELGGNSLVLHIYPTEGMSLSLQAKKPGPKLSMGRMELDFDYCSLGKRSSDDAYERLLLDALQGDPTLFIRDDFIEESWKLFTPVLEKWAEDSSLLEFYPAGSEGPLGAHKLTAPAAWRPLELK